MYRQSLLGLALILITSCVPSQDVRQHRSPASAIAAAEPLLRRLELNVPDRSTIGAPTDSNTPINPFLATSRGAPPFTGVPQTADDATRAVECLTAAVYYEARSEPVDGQRAVAQVVLNRVRDRAFPHSVCGVVYQGSTRTTGCQFSFTCDGSTNHPRDYAAWDRARAVAEAALGGAVYAPVGPATFYHTQAVLPWWSSSLAKIGTIGSHIFYGWHGALERALGFRQQYAGLEPDMAVPATPANAASGGYAVADDSGVIVHRGGLSPASGAAAARTVVSSGIRVHFGGKIPGARALPTVDAQGAIIGEETGPI